MSRFKGFFAQLTHKPEIAMATACGAGLVGFGLNFLPHNLGLEKHREFLQSYNKGHEREIPEHLTNLYNRALRAVEIREQVKHKIKPFAVFGFDTLTIGSTNFRQGVYVGLPVNYFYESVSDIERDDILIRNKKIDWNSKQGKLLEEALVLHDDEKLFGILRAMIEADSYKVLCNSVYPFVCILFMYTVGGKVNAGLGLLRQPFFLRGCLYLILGLFGYGLYSFMTDFTEVQMEAYVDKELSTMGPQLIEAGVKFYNKLLQKNIAIRELTNDTTYTSKGNINYMIRQRSLPLTLRKQFFEQKLAEISLEESNQL